ncbi:MAG: hypothetical protein KBT11_05440 [Treponema sp.]|nr:hypothetical protein [Candidatus Treponema equifaecale]
MEKSQLSPIQQKISEALESMKERALITEPNLAKKVRFISKIEGKNKALIGFEDLEKSVEYLASNNLVIFSLTLNSANEFLIKKDTVSQPVNADARKRRLASEKSKSILTNNDLIEKKSSKKSKSLNQQKKIRTKSEKINIYSDFENMDE